MSDTISKPTNSKDKLLRRSFYNARRIEEGIKHCLDILGISIESP